MGKWFRGGMKAYLHHWLTVLKTDTSRGVVLAVLLDWAFVISEGVFRFSTPEPLAPAPVEASSTVTLIASAPGVESKGGGVRVAGLWRHPGKSWANRVLVPSRCNQLLACLDHGQLSPTHLLRVLCLPSEQTIGIDVCNKED